MPIRATRRDTRTVHHTGTLPFDPPRPPAGFEVILLRAGRPGEPPPGADRARPGRMRRLGRAHIRLRGLEVLVETAELLISELVTNGFEHGHGRNVIVRLTRADRHIRIHVAGGPGPGAGPVPRIAGPGEESGRGPHLVSALADPWGVTPRHGHTWAALAIPHHAGVRAVHAGS